MRRIVSFSGLWLLIFFTGTATAVEQHRIEIGSLSFDIPLRAGYCVVEGDPLGQRLGAVAFGGAGRAVSIAGMHMECPLYDALRAGATDGSATGDILAWFHIRTGEADDRLTEDQQFQFQMIRTIARAPAESDLKREILNQLAGPFARAGARALGCLDLVAGVASLGGRLCYRVGGEGPVRDIFVSASVEPLAGMLLGAMVLRINQPDAPPPVIAEADALLEHLRHGAVQ